MGAADGQAPAGAPAPPVVTLDATTLLFSYLDERGHLQAVSSINDVPHAVRPRVLVVDLAKTPAERQAHKYAFFVDLTTQNEDGTYPVTVQSRYDAADPKTQAPSALPDAPPGSVVVYSAVWCGYCKKAKAWLTERAVPFIERDVERMPGAQAELSKKLADANVAGGGIPVIDWGGTLVMGFDQRRLEALLQQRAK
jgi:glutaredoxin